MQRNPEKVFKEFLEKRKHDALIVNKFEEIYRTNSNELIDKFRLTILDRHADIEAGLNLILMKKFLKEDDDLFHLFELNFLDKISFIHKVKFLKTIKLISNKVFNKIEKINTLRNQCAHPLIDKIIYNNTDLNKNKSIILELSDDINLVYKEFAKLIKT